MSKQVRVILDEETYRKLIVIKGWCTTVHGYETTIAGAVASAIDARWEELRASGDLPPIEGITEP